VFWVGRPNHNPKGLLLVVSSIRQNTAVMHTTNDNFLYQRQDAIVAALATNPSLAEVV
jgi:hypothetical protein